jgi:DNA-nicking Smr family endonuclease
VKLIKRTAGAPAPAAAAPDAVRPAADVSFRDAVRDVKPLRPAAAARVTAPAPRAARPPRPRTPQSAVEVPAALPGAAPLTAATVAAGDVLSFRRPGVRDRTLRQLKRGSFAIEAEVDLHGQSQSSARDELARFLDDCRRAGRRCVRIIHGKGYRSGARGPILKSAVNDWLRRDMDVMAFVSARPIDGGTGAVYVLLRA